MGPFALSSVIAQHAAPPAEAASAGDRFITLYEHLQQHPILEKPLFTIFGLPIYFTNHVLAELIAGLILLLLMGFLARRRASEDRPRGVLQNLLEAFVFYVRDEMVYKTMGEHHGRKFLPLFLTQFFFILTLNLFGLLPNFLAPLPVLSKLHFPTTATANLSVTLAFALVTFFAIHVSGIKEQGLKHYFQTMIPPGLSLPFAILMYPIEILGHLIKPTALTVRLFANMTGGHLALLTIYGLVYFFASFAAPIAYSVLVIGIGFSVFLMCLELLVALLQAYIFTYLSIIFVGAAVHPEH